MPVVNMGRIGRDLVIEAMLPGIEPDTLEVDVYEQTVDIRGESQPRVRVCDEWFLHEGSTGRVERSIDLPIPVNGNTIEAECANGVLTLIAPNAYDQTEEHPTHVSVKWRGLEGERQSRRLDYYDMCP